LPSSSSPSSLPLEALQRYLQAPISLIDKVIKEKQAEAEKEKLARETSLFAQQHESGACVQQQRKPEPSLVPAPC
jgi:hypothetical protein